MAKHKNLDSKHLQNENSSVVADFLQEFTARTGVSIGISNDIHIMSGPGGGWGADFNKKIIKGMKQQSCVAYHVRGTGATFVLYNPELGRDAEFVFAGQTYPLPKNVAQSVKTLWALHARESLRQCVAKYRARRAR